MTAPQPIAERDSGKLAEFKRLLVAVDGSEQSHYAAQVAERLARQLQAELVLVHVFVEPRTSNPDDFLEPEVRANCVAAAQALLDEFKEKLPASLKVESVLREGDPASEILQAAGLHEADLIIMGTHARGRLAEVVLGSVAHAVTRRAACPVLTVAHAPPADGTSPATLSEQTAQRK